MLVGNIGQPPAKPAAPADPYAEIRDQVTRPKITDRRGLFKSLRPMPDTLELVGTGDDGRALFTIVLRGLARDSFVDAALRAGRDLLDAVSPAVPLRDRLTVSEGGNEPVKGRPRTKRRLGLVR